MTTSTVGRILRAKPSGFLGNTGEQKLQRNVAAEDEMRAGSYSVFFKNLCGQEHHLMNRSQNPRELTAVILGEI